MRNLKIILLIIISGLFVAFSTWRAAPAVAHWWKQSHPPIHSELAVPSLRYPYSVIDGGVRTEEDIHKHEQNDPVVANHYRDFNEVFVFYKNPHKLRGYVSYRIGNSIYWTHNRVTIPAGELLFTNGSLIGRARCGNRVSLQPQQPMEAWPTVAEGTLDNPYLMAPVKAAWDTAPGTFNEVLPSPPEAMFERPVAGTIRPVSTPAVQSSLLLPLPGRSWPWMPLAGGVYWPATCKKGSTLVQKTVHGESEMVCSSTDGTSTVPVTPVVPISTAPEPAPLASVGCALCLLAVGLSVARKHH